MTDQPVQLGLSFYVEDDATAALGAIEKGYLDVTKSMGKATRAWNQSVYTQNDSMGQAEEAVESVGNAQKKTTGRFQEATDALKDNAIGMEKLGFSWSKVIKVLSAVSIGAAIAGIAFAMKKAIDAALEFRREFSKLNEVYSLSRAQAAEVSSTVLNLSDRFGKTREEVFGMTRRLLDLGHIPGVVDKLGMSFGSLAKVTLDLSAATGIGMDASAEFADHLLRINRIPAISIRNIGSAIKSVADNSRISADQLMQFNSSLEPLFAVLSDQSGQARADFTTNMLGLAGALSDVGVDASKATSQFADMLDSTSESGVQALTKLSQFTGMGTEQLREMIATNPSAVFDSVSKAASRMPISELQLMGKALQPLGLEFVDLAKLRKTGQEFERTGSSFQKRAEAAAAAAANDNALADKAAKRQERLERVTKRFSRLWENMLIKIGGALTDNVLGPLMDNLMPLLNDLAKWVAGVDWNGVFEKVGDGIRTVIKYAKEFKDQIFGWSKSFGGAWLALKAGSSILGPILTLSKSVGWSLGMVRSGVTALPSVLAGLKSAGETIQIAGMLIGDKFKLLGSKLAGKGGMIAGVAAAGAAGFAVGTLLRKMFPVIDTFTTGLFNSAARLMGFSHALSDAETSAKGLDQAMNQSAATQRRLTDIAGAAMGEFKEGSVEWARAAFMVRDATKSDLEAWSSQIEKSTGLNHDAAMAKLQELQAANITAAALNKIKGKHTPMMQRQTTAQVVRRGKEAARAPAAVSMAQAQDMSFPEAPTSMGVPAAEALLAQQTRLQSEGNEILRTVASRLQSTSTNPRAAHVMANAS